MKKSWLLSVCILLSLFGISGCGKKVQEMAQDFLMEHGEEINQAIDNGLDAIQEYGAVGRKHYFENEEEAKAYLLEGLKERYGIEFMIAELRSYNQYGPIYGDVCTVKAAPAESPEQVFLVRAEQTGEVMDCYWEILFQDALQEELSGTLRAICEEKEYIQSFTVEIGGDCTERAWTTDDSLEDVISAADVKTSLTIYVEDGETDEAYADMVLDFLESLYASPRKARVHIYFRLDGQGEYIFTLHILPEEESYPDSKEELIESISELKKYKPPTF